jgi:chromosome segregation ATPase
MLGGADQKALFDYWHDRVRLTNLNRLGAREHVTTQELRHECTNYDELRRLKAVQELDELERCRVIAIIKYECTAKVLQRRTGLLRDYARQCEEQALDHRQKERGLLALITKLKDILKGKDGTIRRLESRINALQAENEVLRSEQQQSKAESQLRKELDALQRAYEAEVELRIEAEELKAQEEERRKQLAKNNQSLGGRVAHTNRYRRERDELREALRIERQTSQALRRELDQLRGGEQLGLGIAE